MLMMKAVMAAKRWIPLLYAEGTEYVEFVEGYSVGAGSQSKEAGYLYINAADTGTVAVRTYVTDIMVNLTGAKTLKIDWANTGSEYSGNDSFLVVSTNKTGGYGTYDLRIPSPGASFARMTSTLDVSGISGKYYIRVHACDTNTSTERRCRLYVYNIWLEK